MPMLISVVLEVCIVSDMVFKEREDKGHGLLVATSLQNTVTKSQDKLGFATSILRGTHLDIINNREIARSWPA